MNTFLIQLGTMSLQASLAILVVFGLRKIFASTGVSKKYVMFLWMIPFLLLICPWKISIPVGFWTVAPSDYNEQYTEHAMERWAESLLITERAQVEESAETAGKMENVAVLEADDAENADTEYHIMESDMTTLQKILEVATYIWLTGLVVFLLYAAISYVLLKKKLSCCVRKEDGTYRVDNLPVPMVAGFLRPRIYLPSDIAEEHVDFVVEHEKTHIRRMDPLTKLVAYVIVCIHWINPFVWLAYHFLEKDMEMACDEETIRCIGTEKRKAYATALVQLSVGGRRVFTVPLAFGEGDTKGRIKNVMHYKKTVKSAAILAVALGILILTVFMTKQEKDADFVMTNETVISDTKQDEIARQESEALEQLVQIEKEKERLEQELIEQEKQKAEEEITKQDELTFEMVRTAAADYKLHELDFHSYSNGEKESFEEGSGVLNYYVNFYYIYEGETYKLGVSHWLEDDTLNAVYLTRESDGETRWLYDREGGYSGLMEDLLATKENISDWMSIELPEGYTIDNYNANLGWSGGALILPQAYELHGEGTPFAPQEWYHAGFIGKIDYAHDWFVFENKKLLKESAPRWNHTSGEAIDVLDLDWQTIFADYNHDLYTASEAWDLVEEGIDIEQIDTTSDYWYFFFAKEGEFRAYYISLSQNLFTKEEAIAIAETVDILE